MGTVDFPRPPRAAAPRMPGGEVGLQAPPELPRAVPGNLLAKLLPVVMVVAMVGMVALMFTSGMASNPMALMFPIMMVVSMLGMFGMGSRGNGTRAAELNEERKDYLRYLGQVREEVAETVALQRAALEWDHPDPADLWTLAGSGRMWERAGGDPDFGAVRIGRGSQRLATRIVAPETGPVEDLEPISVVALRRFVRTHSVVRDLPIALALRGFAAVGIDAGGTAAADPGQGRALVRAMLCQLAVAHGPGDLAVAVVAGQGQAADWEWVKWLPHHQHAGRLDGAGTARLSAGSLREVEAALTDELAGRPRFLRSAPATPGRRHLVVVLDGGVVDGDEAVVTEDGLDGVTVVDLGGAVPGLVARRGLRLVVADGRIGAPADGGTEWFATADQLAAAPALACALALSRYRAADPRTVARTAADPRATRDWAALLGLGDVARLDPDRVWRPRSPRERLRVPVGVGADGAVVELDLKEAAENGMGPHGLCVGATGSGKSEFLRTLVLGLVATHPPSALNLVLVDFKGGATFLGLESSPHVAAVITNLADEIAMVDRMRDALEGEMNRRQELLRAAGNFANVGDYERARAGGAALAPLPALFIVVDEFSELLSQKPDFADLFVAIGRLGRSLHMHLLLASQRLDEGRMRGLDSHLSYRIALKTFSANESRSVLGVPDAYHLPSVPGSAFLKCDSADPVRFDAAYVSGAYAPARAAARPVAPGGALDTRVRAFSAARVALPPPPGGAPAAPAPQTAAPQPSAPPAEAGGRTVLDTVVGRVRGYPQRAHEVWLPPLNESPTIGQLVPPSARHRSDRPAGAGRGGEQPGGAGLTVPVGLVDRPYDQRRDPLVVDLSGARGNVAIVGGPQSGKSTAARALVVALSATHPPTEVQFYCLDFGGGALAGLSGVPHVGSVAGRLEPDRVRRTVAETAAVVRSREQLFRRHGIDSMAEYRRRKAAPDAPADLAADPFGDVFLVIDGWAGVRQDFEALEPAVLALAAQGLSFGVHLVVTAARWSELRIGLKDQLGTRLELRLGDTNDSEMNRRAAALVPEVRPGRGVTREGLHLLVALPRLDAGTGAADLAAGVAATVAELTARAGGRAAPPVRMLPERFTREDLLAQVAAAGRAAGPLAVPVGIDEAELAPVLLDFAAQPHLVVYADGESGKTTLLRGICAGLVEAGTPQQVRIILGDYRRTMLGAVGTDHLAGYALNAANLQEMMVELAGRLAGRLPGPATTQQQLRERSWWTGPEVFVVVDDYDLVAGAAGNPLAPLLEYLPQAKDVGLHLVVARRAGGAGRALFEPVLAKLRDLSPMGLVMNGSRDEGALVGTVRPAEQPPGRGVLVTRAGGAQLVQTAWMAPL